MFKRLIILLIAGLVVVACGDTGQTSSDAQSAQTLLPNIVGYNTTNADGFVDSLLTAAGAAGLGSGNVAVTAASAKTEQMLQCMQDRGAVASNFYVEQGVSAGNVIPMSGMVVVVNQDRVAENFVNCLLGGQQDGITAQAAVIEPCANAGTFQFQGDTVSYLYASTHPALCAIFQGHFDSIIANNS